MKRVTGRFFDWVSSHIEGIFIQWVIVTVFEGASFINLFGGLLGSVGFKETINGIWNHASQFGDILWWVDTIFYGISFIISKFHKFGKKYGVN